MDLGFGVREAPSEEPELPARPIMVAGQAEHS